MTLTKEDFEIQGTTEAGFWFYIPKQSRKYEVQRFRDNILQLLKLERKIENKLMFMVDKIRENPTDPSYAYCWAVLSPLLDGIEIVNLEEKK